MQNCYDQDIYDVLNLDDGMVAEDIGHGVQEEQQEDIQSFFHFRHQVKEKIQVLPSTAQSQAMDIEIDVEENCQDSRNIEQTTQLSSFNQKGQAHSGMIEYSEGCMSRRVKIWNGYVNETQNLGKNFKSLTVSFLRVLMQSRCLDVSCEQVIRNFDNTNGGIDDFNRLFMCEQIRWRCLDYYQSKIILRSIMKSGRLDFRSKLAMLRHLEMFRGVIGRRMERWKMGVR